MAINKPPSNASLPVFACLTFALLLLVALNSLSRHTPASQDLEAAVTQPPEQQQQQQQRDSDMVTAATQVLRPVVQLVPGMKLSEGAGVRICRTVGTPQLRNLDPFLMLDELKLPAHQAAAGFPDHPHRGFETCSIMLEGEMQHADSAGNKGVIGPGGVQWMTAGRGIIHSEMPVSRAGRLWGFQLWINLPRRHKMMKPRYQDYQADDIPEAAGPGSSVRVMAGEHAGTRGPIVMKNPGLLLDVRLQAGAEVTLAVPQGWQSFAYVYDGAGTISGTKAKLQHALVFGDGDHIVAQAAAAAPATDAAAAGGSGSDGDGYASAGSGLRFLLMAGQPIREPIVQHGPFVMNSQAEIQAAFEDYQAGRLQNPNDNVWAADDEL